MPWFFIQLRYMKPFLSALPNHCAERRGRLSVMRKTCQGTKGRPGPFGLIGNKEGYSSQVEIAGTYRSSPSTNNWMMMNGTIDLKMSVRLISGGATLFR